MSALALGGVAAALSPVALYLLFDRLVRRGLAAPRVVQQDSPADYGLDGATVRIAGANGKTLHAWMIRSSTPTAPTVIIMHGWGGNAAMMLPLAVPLHRAGANLLLVDARCHGRSDEDSFASLPRFAEDLSAAHDWLLAAAEGQPGPVIYLGHSVGAAAALYAAAGRRDVAAVVSISAFAHPRDMMTRWLSAQKVPALVGRLVLAHVQRVIGHRFDAIAPLRSVTRLQCPVLLIHGDRDTVVPPEDARRIHAASGRDDCELLILAGEHERFDRVDHEIGALLAFLERVGSPAQG